MADTHSLPPRPKPVFRVGVTGDRLATLLGDEADLTALRRNVRSALAEIQQAVRDAAGDFADVFDGPATLHLVTTLNDGADHLAAAEARELGYQLHVPLPCPIEQFLTGFEIPPHYKGPDPRRLAMDLLDGATVQILDGRPNAVPDTKTNTASANAVVRHSDLLIAVGSGKTGQHHAGAAEVVRRAKTAGLSVLLIEPRQPDRWRWEHHANQVAPPDIPAAVRDILAPPPPKEHDRAVAATPLLTYLRTPTDRTFCGGLFALCVRVIALQRPSLPFKRVMGTHALDKARRDWDTMWQTPAPVDPAVVQPLTEKLREYYVSAETLGNGYGALHRDSSTIPYLLAPMVVFFALAAHFGQAAFPGTPRDLWFLCAGLELFTVFWIFVYYLADVAGGFHDRWIDNRSLAELLRQLEFLWPLGRSVPAARFGGETQGEATRFSWIAWYVRAVGRQAGLFPGTMTPERLATIRQMLIDRFIRHQCEYHDQTARRLDHVHERLHVLGLALFAGAALSTVIHLAVPSLTETGEALTAIGAIWLPACGAAVHGFMSHGDFWNLSRRSERMCANLTGLVGTAGGTPGEVEALGAVAEQTAEIMSEELLYWRVFTRLKPAALV